MSRTITLGPEQEALLQRLLDSGRFPDEAAAISAGLERLGEEHDALSGWSDDALRQAAKEGAESGPGIPAAEVFAELRDRYANWPRAASRK